MNTSGRDRDSDITLRLRKEVHSGSSLTQRTLSNRLDIALGLVNAYIKRLANKGHRKGYIKASIHPRGKPRGMLQRFSLRVA